MITEQQQKEIVKAIKDQGEVGATSAYLYSKSASFETTTEVAKALHQLVQQGVCYKSEGVYKLNYDPSSVNPLDVSRQSTPKVFHTAPIEIGKYVAKTVPPKPVVKEKTGNNKSEIHVANKPPNGKLKRYKLQHAVVMSMYLYRNFNHALTIEDIKQVTTVAYTTAQYEYAISNLLDGGYIKRIGGTLGYRWTNNFNYPYPMVESDDEQVVRIRPQHFLLTSDSMTPTSVTVNTETTDNVIDTPVNSPVRLLEPPTLEIVWSAFSLSLFEASDYYKASYQLLRCGSVAIDAKKFTDSGTNSPRHIILVPPLTIAKRKDDSATETGEDETGGSCRETANEKQAISRVTGRAEHLEWVSTLKHDLERRRQKAQLEYELCEDMLLAITKHYPNIG